MVLHASTNGPRIPDAEHARLLDARCRMAEEPHHDVTFGEGAPWKAYTNKMGQQPCVLVATAV